MKDVVTEKEHVKFELGSSIRSGEVKVLVSHFRPDPVMTHVHQALGCADSQQKKDKEVYRVLTGVWAEFCRKGGENILIVNGKIYARYRRTRKTVGELLRTPWSPATKGGITFCTLFGDGIELGVGKATCSEKDAFCYRIGYTKALGRAVSDAVNNILSGKIGAIA
jgi:hypothetical protein